MWKLLHLVLWQDAIGRVYHHRHVRHRAPHMSHTRRPLPLLRPSNTVEASHSKHAARTHTSARMCVICCLLTPVTLSKPVTLSTHTYSAANPQGACPLLVENTPTAGTGQEALRQALKRPNQRMKLPRFNRSCCFCCCCCTVTHLPLSCLHPQTVTPSSLG